MEALRASSSLAALLFLLPNTFKLVEVVPTILLLIGLERRATLVFKEGVVNACTVLNTIKREMRMDAIDFMLLLLM